MFEQDRRINTKFAKLGGTWGMQERANGGLKGVGNLGDEEIREIERSLGLDRETSAGRINELERELALIMYSRLKQVRPLDLDAEKPFVSWCPEFHHYVKGLFLPLVGWDSSHFRPSLVAPVVAYLLEEAIKNPDIPIIGAQGTDTADAGPLPIIDPLVFDTHLPPFIFTGADHSHLEENSDAPHNFEKLAQLARVDVRNFLQYNPFELSLPHKPWFSGVYWVYHNELYKIADLAKVSPVETREIEGQTTFFAPNGSAIPFTETGWLEMALDEVDPSWPQNLCTNPLSLDIAAAIKMEDIFDALSSIYTVDLGNMNRIGDEIGHILDPQNKAIIIAAHGLGNTNNPIRWACIKAAKQGKLVIDTSRCLVATVNQRYAGSLLDANVTSGELLDTGFQIINGRRLNKIMGRAVAVRALLEGKNQNYTQRLLDVYHKARFIEQGGYNLDDTGNKMWKQ